MSDPACKHGIRDSEGRVCIACEREAERNRIVSLLRKYAERDYSVFGDTATKRAVEAAALAIEKDDPVKGYLMNKAHLAMRLGISINEARALLLQARDVPVCACGYTADETPGCETPKQQPMTGRQLLEALQRLPHEALDLPVATEGWDCWGNVGVVAASSACVELYRT